MNILTRNVPRQYLRNGNLNLTGEGYSSFSYGLSGMTGGYLPALPLEEGGYLVEDPVTFMQKILIQGDTQIEGNTQIDGNLNVYGDSNLKDTNIDGDINLTGKIYVNGEEFKGDESKGGYSSYGTRHKQVSGVDAGAEIVIDMGGSDFAEGTIRIYAAYTNSYLEDPTTDYSAVYNVMIDSYSYSEDTNFAMGLGSGVSNKFYKKIQDGKVYIYLPIPYGYIKSIGAHFSTFSDDKRLEEGTENKVVQLNRVHNSVANTSNYSALPVYTMESKVKDLNNRVDSVLGELEYSEYFGSKSNVYNKQIFFELGGYGSGYPIDPSGDEYDQYGAIYGYVEIMDRYGGYDVCLLHIPYTISKSESNVSGHEFYDCLIGGCSVVGGYYDWDIYCKWEFSNSGISYLTGRKIAVCLNAQSNTIHRIKARFYDMRGDSGRIILPSIFDTTITGNEEYSPHEYWHSGKSFSYNPRYISNYHGDANIYGNTLLKSGNDIINNHYMVYGGSSGVAQQYGIRLESSGEGYSNQMLSYINVSGYYGVDMYGQGLNIEVANGYKLTTDYHDGFLINGAKILTQNDIYPKKDIYTKEEVNNILQNYYSINSVYTKTEVNELLDNLEIDKYYKKEESDERYYTKEETESISEELVKENYDYYFKPVIQRVTNIESQLGDIEILLDKILGYEANEYLNETLDEIIG